MKLGIIGSEGVVGAACKFGFGLIGKEVKENLDKKLGLGSLEDL